MWDIYQIVNIYNKVPGTRGLLCILYMKVGRIMKLALEYLDGSSKLLSRSLDKVLRWLFGTWSYLMLTAQGLNPLTTTLKGSWIICPETPCKIYVLWAAASYRNQFLQEGLGLTSDNADIVNGILLNAILHLPHACNLSNRHCCLYHTSLTY